MKCLWITFWGHRHRSFWFPGAHGAARPLQKFDAKGFVCQRLFPRDAIQDPQFQRELRVSLSETPWREREHKTSAPLKFWRPRFGHNDPQPCILAWFLITCLSRRRLSTRIPIVFRALGLPRLPAGSSNHDRLRPQNGRDLGLFLGPPGPPGKSRELPRVEPKDSK